MGLAGVGALAAAGVGALGLISSFDAVSAAAARWGFGEPWMLPVGIDVAIPVFTVANLLLIRMDMALAWVRFVPWILTLVTCGLNVAAGHGMWAKVAHGTMPLLWVVFSEIGAHIYAVRIGAATGRRMDKIRASRWLLAFPSTFSLWRRMTLWEITSYADALAREKERQLARAELRETYGWRWRSKTPRRERVLLRLGELAPEGAEEEAAPEPPAPTVPPQEPSEPKPRKRTARPKKPATKTVRTAAELLAAAREITADWADAAINAEAIRTELHCSAANSRTLRDALLAERAERLPLHSIDTHADETAEEVAA
ncbi:DUF2637 domain-containing protein [Streptomyces sp. HUAS YS2]|uniref:DUF2637 domain-containing protein n=2 Tax=Streptomyces solicathayae TaxID=3081768 RepID=A0ABZ0M591_9ACTN|nr:DUF2637 domain-containing protein [Streptomyces sp. HUAS YS2]WOX26645.1 DUF2637 domain-containing protein [Streptomyces sp. HUAS YS2]